MFYLKYYKKYFFIVLAVLVILAGFTLWIYRPAHKDNTENTNKKIEKFTKKDEEISYQYLSKLALKTKDSFLSTYQLIQGRNGSDSESKAEMDGITMDLKLYSKKEQSVGKLLESEYNNQTKNLSEQSNIQNVIDPIRDIYLASRLKDANPFVIVYRTNDPATYGKAFTCFSEKTVKIEQSCIFDYKDALAKIEPNIIRSWQYTHTRTDIDFSYPARSINLKQKCKITLGTRLSFSDIGECAFRLQNCIFTNGGTILLPQEASRKKSNKLSPEGIVKDYNSQCYMKFDKIMEQLKSYGTIPVTDMQQSVWNILEKLKFSSAFGFSNTRDLQKNYLSTFEKEGDALDVVIKILKIPGVLQRNYPGTTHDRVNECIGKIFNLKMEKLIV